MKRTFNFGKIDYNHSGRRNCLVTVDIELRTLSDGKPEFVASGSIWNPRHTDIYCGGQCLDTIAEFVTDPVFTEIHRLWKTFHLNSLHAGTDEQEAEINSWLESTGSRYYYDEVCGHLRECGLFEVEYNGKLYRYGSGWIYREIPQNDLELIKNLIEGA